MFTPMNRSFFKSQRLRVFPEYGGDPISPIWEKIEKNGSVSPTWNLQLDKEKSSSVPRMLTTRPTRHEVFPTIFAK